MEREAGRGRSPQTAAHRPAHLSAPLIVCRRRCCRRCFSLVHGDVEGNFDSVFSRVGKVHASKAGPFDVLLCVGTFFGRKGAKELDDYVAGRKQGQCKAQR